MEDPGWPQVPGAGMPGRRLQMPEQLFIVGVSAYPEPYDHVAVENANRAPVHVDAHRLDWQLGVDLLEAERRMVRIL